MDELNKKVAIALVGDFKYLRKYFNNLYSQIRNIGNYDGEIVVITTKFCPTYLVYNLRKKNNIKILRFSRVKFDKKTENSLNNLETFDDPNRNKTKKFQWHKLHLFDKKLKKWDFIFYLDINMYIHSDLNKLLEDLPVNLFKARADSYPTYNISLESQFDASHPKFDDLKNKYDLDVKNYFQTGVMFFDTKIISNETKDEILDLIEKYPLSTTNEQGILNLYFMYQKNVYEELPKFINGELIYFYWKIKNEKVVITKQNQYKYK